MKNLKKLMSVILTVAMLLSMLATSVGAATFADVEEDNAAYEAIEVMAALEILEGKEEGNFDPEANIKRSEFAAVICRAMNQEAAAAGSASVAKFTDVAAGHWAAGYINWAAGQGIVNGTDAELGTFEPDANVTYEQAVAMIVRAMGFEPLALKRGGFPTGYMVIAAGYKVTDGVAMVPANGAATRAGVAQLVYNALDAATMEEGFGVNIYGGTLYNIYDGKENDKATLLSKYHNIYAVEAYVKNTFNSDTSLMDTRKDVKKVELVTVVETNDEDKVIGANDFTAAQLKDGLGVSSFTTLKPIVNNDAYGDYLGYYVKAFLTVDEDDKLVLVAMVPDTKNVDTITINNVKANIVKSAVASNKVDFEFYEDEDYLNDDLEFVDFDKLTIYKNGEEVTTGKETTFTGIAGNAAYAQVVLLGNDEVYNKVFITEYKYAIVESVNAETGRVKFEEGADLPSLNLSKDNDAVFAYSIYKDGEAITLADVAEGDLLNIIKTDAGDSKNSYEIYVTNEVVEDAVTYFDPTNNTYTIGGAEYSAVHQAEAGEPNWNPGNNGAFYITIDGRIFDAKITSGFTGNYAFILNGGLVNNGGATSGYYELQVLTKDNVVDIYKVASSLKVWDTYDSKYGVKTYTMDGANKQEALFGDSGKISSKYALNNNGEATTATIADLFVTVKIENDEITTISFPAAGEDFNSKALSGDKYNKDRNYVKQMYTTDATVVFDISLDSVTKKVTEDSVQVYTISRLNDEDLLTGTAYAIDKNDEIGALAITAGLTDLMDANALALVTGISQGLNNGEQASILNVFVGGELVGYPVSDKYTTFADLALAKGDVIQLNTNAAGEVDKVQVVYDYSDKAIKDVTNADGDEYLYYAGVVTNNKRGLVIEDAANNDTSAIYLKWDLSDESTNVMVDVAKWGRNNDIVAKADYDHIVVDIDEDKFVAEAYVVVVRTNEDNEILDIVTYEYEDYKDTAVADLIAAINPVVED